MVNRFHSLRHAWFWLAIAHLATVLLLVGIYSVRILPKSTLFAINIGQLSFLGVWLAMGRGRLSHRLGIVAIMLCLSAPLMAVALMSPQTLLTIPGFLSFTMVLGFAVWQLAIVSLPLILLRAMGWRLVHSSETPTTVGGSPIQFRVSHLIGLMTLVAGMLVLRALIQSLGTVDESGAVGFSPGTGVIPMITVFGVTYCLLSAAVVTGFWACLGPHRPGYRLTIPAIPVTSLCALPIHVFGGAAQISWAVSIATIIAVVIASLLLLRNFGVRLETYTSLSDMFSDARATQ